MSIGLQYHIERIGDWENIHVEDGLMKYEACLKTSVSF